MKGQTGGPVPVPLGAPPSLRTLSQGCGSGLPSCPQHRKSSRGTGNQINSFSKLLISGEEEKILQLDRVASFTY